MIQGERLEQLESLSYKSLFEGVNNLNKQAYWGREVAEALGISGSSLRKYCMALEKSGHHFAKGSNNSRAFTERDIILLRRMKDLIQDRGVTTQDASEIVLSSDSHTPRTGVVRGEHPLVKQELSDVRVLFEQQKQLNIQLINEFQKIREEFHTKFDQQQRYIESLEKQLHKEKEYQEQRDQQLINIARDILETKKLVAASKEEAKNEKKKRWWRFW